MTIMNEMQKGKLQEDFAIEKGFRDINGKPDLHRAADELAKKTDYLRGGNVSFEEHIENLDKMFIDFNMNEGSKMYLMAKMMKAMINFELVNVTVEKAKKTVKVETKE